jgi:hypothetical protein
MIGEESGPEAWQGREKAPTDVSINELDIVATCTRAHASRARSRWSRRATARARMLAWTGRSHSKSGAAPLAARRAGPSARAS